MIVSIFLLQLIGINEFWNIIQAPFTFSAKLFLLFSNLLLFGSDWAMFTHPTPDGIEFTSNFALEEYRFHPFFYISPAWSLPVELSFYLLAPFMIKSIRVILLFFSFSVLSIVVTYSAFGQHDPWNYRFMPNELTVFCLGMLAHKFKAIFIGRAHNFIGWALIFAISYSFYKWDWFAHNFGAQFTGCFLIMLLIISSPLCFHATKKNSFDRFLGELSYPIYLIHVPILTFVSYIFSPSFFELAPKSLLVCIFSLLISIPIHSLSKRVDIFFRKKFKFHFEKKLADRNSSIG